MKLQLRCWSAVNFESGPSPLFLFISAARQRRGGHLWIPSLGFLPVSNFYDHFAGFCWVVQRQRCFNCSIARLLNDHVTFDKRRRPRKCRGKQVKSLCFWFDFIARPHDYFFLEKCQKETNPVWTWFSLLNGQNSFFYFFQILISEFWARKAFVC